MIKIMINSLLIMFLIIQSPGLAQGTYKSMEVRCRDAHYIHHAATYLRSGDADLAENAISRISDQNLKTQLAKANNKSEVLSKAYSVKKLGCLCEILDEAQVFLTSGEIDLVVTWIDAIAPYNQGQLAAKQQLQTMAHNPSFYPAEELRQALTSFSKSLCRYN